MLGQQTGEGVLRLHLGEHGILGELFWCPVHEVTAALGDRCLPVDHEVAPHLLHCRDVLDDVPQAEGTRGGAQTHLVLIQVAGRIAHEVPGMAERGNQILTFDGGARLLLAGGDAVGALVVGGGAGHYFGPLLRRYHHARNHWCQFLSLIAVNPCDAEVMADTSARTLQLLSLLQGNRYWLGDELAERLGVSLRTLRRDVERLRTLGYPAAAGLGVGGGYQMTPGAAMPAPARDVAEAVASTVGLIAASRSGLSGTAESSVRALAKTIRVMPTRLRRQAQALHAALAAPTGLNDPSPVETAVLLALAQVCRDQVRVQFGYVDSHGTASHRSVEPAQLVTVARRWYLACYDLDRADWRSFRLDRIRDVRPTRDPFAPRSIPGGDATRFVERNRARTPAAEEFTADVAAPAAEVRQRIG